MLLFFRGGLRMFLPLGGWVGGFDMLRRGRSTI